MQTTDEVGVTELSSQQPSTQARLVAYPNIAWSSDSASIHLYLYHELQCEHLEDPWVRPERILDFYLSCRLDDLELGPLPHDFSGRTFASDVEVRTFLRFALYDLDLFRQCFPTRADTPTQDTLQDQQSTVPEAASPKCRKARHIFARAATKFYPPNRPKGSKPPTTTNLSAAAQHPSSSSLPSKPRTSKPAIASSTTPAHLTVYETLLAASKAQICDLARRRLLIQPSTSLDNPTTAFVAFYKIHKWDEIVNGRLPFRAKGEVVAAHGDLVLVLLVATNAVEALAELFPREMDAPWWLYSRWDRYCCLDVCWLEPGWAGALLARGADGGVSGGLLEGGQREDVDFEEGRSMPTAESFDLDDALRVVASSGDASEGPFSTMSTDESEASTETTPATPPSPTTVLQGTENDITLPNSGQTTRPSPAAPAPDPSEPTTSAKPSPKPLVILNPNPPQHDPSATPNHKAESQASDPPEANPAAPLKPTQPQPQPQATSPSAAAPAPAASLSIPPATGPSAPIDPASGSLSTAPTTTHLTPSHRRLRTTAFLATRVDTAFVRHQFLARTRKSLQCGRGLGNRTGKVVGGYSAYRTGVGVRGGVAGRGGGGGGR